MPAMMELQFIPKGHKPFYRGHGPLLRCYLHWKRENEILRLRVNSLRAVLPAVYEPNMTGLPEFLARRAD